MAEIADLQRENLSRANASLADRDAQFRSGVDDLEVRFDDDGQPSVPAAPSNSPELLFEPPSWLKGLYPIHWSVADASARKSHEVGRNCCLFYPLGYCHDSRDLVNGFCSFHMRALFNLVYQTDSLYQKNAQGNDAISQRTGCFVADPQAVNGMYTAIFPLMELAGSHELQIGDIKLYHLIKYLRSKKWPNWEKVYTHHVNYVQRLITLYSPQACELRPIELRETTMSVTQLMIHWNLWNEYHSRLLAEHPADINILVARGVEGGTNGITTLPLRKCTTITQMIGRLFSESYVNLNEVHFFTTLASYGPYVRDHWSYSDNLCTIGTYCAKNGITCLGNIATVNMLKAKEGSGCKPKTVHFSTMSDCGKGLCLPSMINKAAPMLNQTVTFAQ